MLALLILVEFCGMAYAQSTSDERYRSPRATVRTLFTAITVARGNPPAIAGAVAALDFGDKAPSTSEAALRATQLETVLRARDFDGESVPDSVEGPVWVFPDWHGLRMGMQRQPDGRWLFDRETVALVPRLFAEAQARIQEKGKTAAELNVSPLYASPRATIYTLIEGYRRHDYQRIRYTMDMSEVPLVARDEVADQLASKLKQIVLRQRRIIVQEIPDANFGEPFVWLSHPAGVIELVRLSAGERKGEWLFSRDTMRSLDRLYVAFEDQAYDPDILASGAMLYLPSLWTEPELWLRSHLPAWWRKSLFSSEPFTLEIYELAGYLLVALLAFGLSRLTVWLASAGLRRLFAGPDWALSSATLATRLRATGLFAATLFVHWGILLLAPDRAVLVPVLAILNPLIWLVGLWAAFGVIDLVSDLVEMHIAAQRRGADLGRMLWPVSSLVLKIMLVVATVFHLMAMLDWDVTAVLTGLGIGGIAVALGAQDALKNLFGSFTLVADRPFLVGESVKIGGREVGVVEMVGLRSTRIRTADDTLLIVPNSKLTDSEITNYGRRRYRHFSTTFRVATTTPQDKLTALREGMRALIARHPHTRKQQIEVAFEDFTAQGITILVDLYFEVANRQEEILARDAIILDVLSLVRELEVELV